MIELANGCICCTVADDFLPAMRTILARDPAPDHIVIETSGLALPKPLVAAFNWPEVRSRLTVDGVLVVADAAAVLAGRFAPDPDAVQARARGRPGARPRDAARGAVRGAARLRRPGPGQQGGPGRRPAIAPRSRPRSAPSCGPACGWSGPATAGSTPPWRWAWASAAEGDLANRPSHHDGGEEHGHDEFESFVLPVPPLADPEHAGRAPARRDPRPRHPAGQGLPRRRRQAACATSSRRWASGSTATTTGPGGRARRATGELVVIGLKGLDRAAIADVILERPTA